MTATIASPGPSSGVGTSCRCRLLRGSFSRVATPSNMPTSSARTTTAWYVRGTGSDATSARRPVRIAVRMSSTGGPPRAMLLAGSRLHELDQHSAGVLRMDEVDPATRRAALRLVVEQAQALGSQRRTDLVDVVDGVRELLDAGPAALEERRDRRVGVQRCEQLDLRLAVADRQHRLAHALLLVDLLGHRAQPEYVAVERDRLVEVRHRDADVVEPAEQHPVIVARDVRLRRPRRALVHTAARGHRG